MGVNGNEDALLFLGMVAFVSLSGVMAPGPMFATTIAKGYNDLRAGLKISFGHAVVEIPLIAAIFLGFDTVLKNDQVFIAIGLVGGVILLIFGADQIRTRHTKLIQKDDGRSSFLSGIIMTAANPYFILWWATVGATLIAGAVKFGPIMLPIFAVVHLSCDFAWNYLLSFSIYKSKTVWNQKWHRYLFVASGGIMVFFGLYFLASSVQSLLA
jgi:threonine/homoserine/homoserine lactone efflux protein